MIIHDEALSVTINVLYQVFSPYGDVEKIVRFQTRGDFHARVNFYSYRGTVHAFCKLQSRRIYDGCCDWIFTLLVNSFVIVSPIFLSICGIMNFLELL